MQQLLENIFYLNTDKHSSIKIEKNIEIKEKDFKGSLISAYSLALLHNYVLNNIEYWSLY